MYDGAGMSKAQQITLENLQCRQARNQRQRREHARQGSKDEKEKEESPDESMQQENREQELTGRGRASIRAHPRPGQPYADCDQAQYIPGGYEDEQHPRPYHFITANVEEHYHGNRPQRKWPNQAALLCQELRKLGQQNPEWAALVSAAQDAVTAVDTTWPEVHANVATPYHGGESNWNPPRGFVHGCRCPHGCGQGRGRAMNHE